MFVSRTEYNRLRRKVQILEMELAAEKLETVAAMMAFNKLNRKWNDLVERINRLGGEEFLRHAKMPAVVPLQFTQEELRTLIFLCHPDKHAGSKSASTITAKLIRLRK